MGIERSFTFPGGSGPTWPQIAAKLGQLGETPVLRMIDGLPAFPDEIPEESWQELRIGLSGGMVTVRRSGPGSLTCVTWGTADPALNASWERCCQAVSTATEPA